MLTTALDADTRSGRPERGVFWDKNKVCSSTANLLLQLLPFFAVSVDKSEAMLGRRGLADVHKRRLAIGRSALVFARAVELAFALTELAPTRFEVKVFRAAVEWTEEQ